MARPRKVDRTNRVLFGVARRKLTLDGDTASRMKRQGKIPRWINEDDARLEGAQEGGYEFVTADGTEVAGSDQAEQGKRIRKAVGKHADGSPKYAYLMAIPKEFYDEDQAKKESVNHMVDQAVQGGNPNGLTHHNVPQDRGGTYVKDVQYQP